jgi:hypothetical protein
VHPVVSMRRSFCGSSVGVFISVQVRHSEREDQTSDAEDH